MKPLPEMIDLERQDEDFDLLAAVQARADSEGWDQLLVEALQILSDLSQQENWRSATCIIFWSNPTRTEMPIPKMAVVARLYWCLIQFPGFGGEGLDDAENLVWTITKDLKGIGYDSDWDPIKDLEVRVFLDALD